MKKVLTIIAAAFIFLTGCTNNLKTYKEIKFADFNRMIENEESFVLYIGSSNCSHCAAYTLTINRVVKQHQVSVHYIDVAKLSNEEYDQFYDMVEFDGTPTTIFIENGKEESIFNRIDGNKSYDKVIEMFRKNNYIK
jgi:predicted bacteriocin transport accessory protein